MKQYPILLPLYNVKLFAIHAIGHTEPALTNTTIMDGWMDEIMDECIVCGQEKFYYKVLYIL
jgi:hypothetical protein